MVPWNIAWKLFPLVWIADTKWLTPEKRQLRQAETTRASLGSKRFPGTGVVTTFAVG